VSIRQVTRPRFSAMTVADGELTRVGRAARGAASVDDVELDL
jgi:hypothetical protein